MFSVTGAILREQTWAFFDRSGGQQILINPPPLRAGTSASTSNYLMGLAHLLGTAGLVFLGLDHQGSVNDHS